MARRLHFTVHFALLWSHNTNPKFWQSHKTDNYVYGRKYSQTMPSLPGSGAWGVSHCCSQNYTDEKSVNKWKCCKEGRTEKIFVWLMPF